MWADAAHLCVSPSLEALGWKLHRRTGCCWRPAGVEGSDLLQRTRNMIITCLKLLLWIYSRSVLLFVQKFIFISNFHHKLRKNSRKMFFLLYHVLFSKMWQLISRKLAYLMYLSKFVRWCNIACGVHCVYTVNHYKALFPVCFRTWICFNLYQSVV